MPLVVYLILQNVISLAVILAYYVSEGYFSMVGGSTEELMNQVMSSTMKDINILNFWSMVAGYVVLIPIFWHMYRKDLAQDQLQDCEKPHEKVPPLLYMILIAAGAASCLAASNMISMSGLIKASENYSAAVDTMYSAGIVPELIGLGILAPMMEELLFRGLLFRRFKEFCPVIRSMIRASLMFALLHGNLVQGIYAFVMGILLCYVYERYGSLKAPVVMHTASNLVAVIASETGILDFIYDSTAMFYGLTFVCCVIVVAMIYLIEHYVRPYTEE